MDEREKSNSQDEGERQKAIADSDSNAHEDASEQGASDLERENVVPQNAVEHESDVAVFMASLFKVSGKTESLSDEW